MNSKNKVIEFNPLMDDLRQFTGSESFLIFAPLGKPIFIYTEGISFLVENGECYWLLEAIASYQGSEALKNEEFQSWKLSVNHKSNAILICDDGNENVLIKQEIPFTDIPLKNRTLTLYLVDSVLMLPTEY